MPDSHSCIEPGPVRSREHGPALPRESLAAQSHGSEWFTANRFAALLGGLIAAHFAAILCGFQTFFLRDFGYFSYPLAQYHRECFWRGELPLWSPFNSCGMPFLAQWNTLTLYPPSLIYLLLPLPWSLNLFCLLHLFAGGMGMYFLAHRWSGNRFAACVAATLFVFSAFTLNCVMWPNNIAALGLMPWVILLVQRGWQRGGRQLLIGSLVGALQMLAGAPEMILLTWFTVAGIFVVDLIHGDTPRTRALVRSGIIGLLIAGIAAIQLLPFFELMRASDRSQNFATASWSMPAWGWANFFVPLFHSYAAPIGTYFQPGQDWIASYYTGVVGVVLAGVALCAVRKPRVWFLAALVFLGVALAFGDNRFLYPALKRVFPQLNFMRYPVKFLILVNFALPLLAAFAVAAILETKSRAHFRTLLIASGAAAIIIAGIVWSAHAHPARSENPQFTQWNGLVRIVVLASVTSLLMGFTRASRDRMIRIMAGLVLLALALDGITHSPKATPSLPAGVLQPGLVKLDPAPGLHGNRAMLIRPAHDEVYATMISDPLKDFVLHRQALFGNCNLIDGVPTPDGFFSLYIKESRQLWSHLWFRQTNYAVSPLLDFLSVAHVNAETIFDWTNRPSALPIATIGQAPVFAEASATLESLLSPAFDPARTVYLPANAKALVRATQTIEAKILSAKFTAHRIQLKVDAAADTVLVLAQSFYGPWRASMDKQPVPILRANHAFQAVPISAGTHDIVFEYRDQAFQTGAIVTFCALILGTGLWFLRPRWL
jgi:hypothetical protein